MDTEEYKSLVRRRSNLKTEVAAHLKFVKKFVESSMAFQAVDIRLGQLKTSINQFEEIQSKIEKLDKRDDQSQADERIQFNDLICDVQASLMTLSEKGKKEPMTSDTVRINDTVRLPAVPAPEFDGNLQNWSAFRDSFGAIFHNNKSLTDVQKLHYLKSCVTKSAGDVIKSFPTTGDNYQKAYDALLMRYENKSLTIQSHIPLDALRQPIHSWDAWLVTLICYKLDNITVGEWQLRQSTRELPKFTELETFLLNRISAYEVDDFNNMSSMEGQHQTMRRAPLKKALFSKSNNLKTPSNVKCVLCTGSHRLHTCDQFLDFAAVCRYGSCHKCGRKHHTKLHEYQHTIKLDNVSTNKLDQQAEVQSSHTSMHVQQHNREHQVMLATAIVKVRGTENEQYELRAVLDSGSQVNFITRRSANLLRLKPLMSTSNISGIGTLSTKSAKLEPTLLSSRFGSYQTSVDLHVLPVITGHLPTSTVDINQFNIPDQVLGNHIKLSPKSFACESQLGWIITGCIPVIESTIPQSLMSTSLTTKQNKISALSFHSPKGIAQCAEEAQVETHFQNSFKRDHNGQFIVKLPINGDPSVLGNSEYMATKSFLAMERRLMSNKALATEHEKFMTEYLITGHMEEIKNTDINQPITYYLPHHAVVKENSITTKTRVVFDASAATSTGISLNDILMRGPTVQPTLYQIILRFRLHNIEITGDIEKMYRQIKVDQLLTVTYGTKSAPYLATKCLSELSKHCTDHRVSRIIKEDFYVDDLLSGGTTVEECCQYYQELTNVLNQFNFPIRKWCSNSAELIAHIPSASEQHYSLLLTEDESITTLGLTWLPKKDVFKFILKPWSPQTQMTKRSLLSDLHKIYDPLGFITPVLIKGKIFLQQLWTIKVDWDTVLPPDIQLKWTRFCNSLQSIENLSIPRLVLCHANKRTITLHGFCDASQNAIGACIYVRSKIVDSEDSWTTALYTSRSRVAPIRTTTIPRLELNGATMLVDLITEVRKEFKALNICLSDDDVNLWTDSSIVLSWINTDTPLKMYVANRITQIHESSTIAQWRYVPSQDNPADLITRGTSAQSLESSTLWWKGPHIPEVRTIKPVLTVTQYHSADLSKDYNILHQYSNWTKLIRITAYIQRFCKNSKFAKTERTIDHLHAFELKTAKEAWVRIAQQEAFKPEITCLEHGNQLSRRSKLIGLSPFLENGIIRVGGRLQLSQLPANQRHPAVLPKAHRVTQLIFEHYHKQYLQAGAQNLLTRVRQEFWHLDARNTARRPTMGNLPRLRVTPSRPFTTTGIDFAGPINLHSGPRNRTTTKAYIAALRRFFSRRGQSSHIYSDNRTKFCGANAELRRLYKQPCNNNKTVIETLAQDEIQWRFNPPSAPHMGGLWEAVVKSTKHHLIRTLKSAKLNFEELFTLLCQFEACLNSRPLTPQSNDPESFLVLTPAHFLVGGCLTLPPDIESPEKPINHIKRWHIVQGMMQGFWRRWSSEYLRTLQVRSKWNVITKDAVIKVGDLVLVKEDNQTPLS
ncbi:Integrase catalytic domain-containing protein, partial [Aphis craccivora]